MSTRFEFYLNIFLDYCDCGKFEDWNKMFEDEYSKEYEREYFGYIYHDSLEEFFNVN